MKVGKRQIVCEELDGEDLSVSLDCDGIYELQLEEETVVYVTLERLLIIKEFLSKFDVQQGELYFIED